METRKIEEVTNLTEEGFRQVNQLWDSEFPNKMNGEFPWWMKRVEELMHYYIEDEKNNIIAWTMLFNRDGETWFSFIVARDYQRKGIGSQLVEKIKKEHDLFHGWVPDHNNDVKKDGTLYLSPLNFYTKRGLEVLHNIRYDERGVKAVKIRWVNNSK